MSALTGTKVIEMAGLAPSSYCGMLLADFGADVVIVDRLSKDVPEIPNVMAKNPFDRGKRSIRVNLKTDEGAGIVREMMREYDVILEPYRPGVMERLGLGPEEALKLNCALIYARLTGWGQSGPYASMAGHDINYIALAGALSLIRQRDGKPIPPCNYLADFAGGTMFCTLGILLALVERNASGKGQVVDAAMVDAVASLSTQFYGLVANDLMRPKVGTNMLDGGAPYYQTYRTRDGRFMAVGAIEARFYKKLLRCLNVDLASLPSQNDTENWPGMQDRFAKIFGTKTRDEWTAIFDGEDACTAPVLELDEVAEHPHNQAREVIINIDGVPQPAPAPRFSRTPAMVAREVKPRGSDTGEILRELGYSEQAIENLIKYEIVEGGPSR